MLKKLKEVATKAYAPYSNFRVSAIFELLDNSNFSGFNVENVAYPNSLCAERVAIVSALTNGIDLNNVIKVHIYSPDSKDFLSPCGGCRQSMSEFLNQNVEIYMYNKNGDFIVKTFKELFPYSVDQKNVKGEN